MYEILDSLDVGIITYDNDMRIIFVNEHAQNLLGYKEEEILGFLPEDSRERFFVDKNQEPLLRLVARNKMDIKDKIMTIKNKNGQIMQLRFDFIKLAGGGYLHILNEPQRVEENLTKVDCNQNKLEQQEKLAVLGQMAAGVVHEIKNPLTTIKGFSQLIAAKIQDETLKEYITTIDKEVDSVNKVIIDFLAYAKPQPIELNKISINKIVQSIYLMVETNTFLKGTELTIILSEEEKEIMADECKIKQVILNIVKNSLEAISETTLPKLLIKTKINKAANQMQIIIVDNGKGMSEETKIKIGTPFFTTKEKGTGLGLSICNQIINEHGGSIEIISELGKGSSFIISLPCA